MHGYNVSRLAELAGVSVRTLHHYDNIGLLVPGERTAAGYRIYGSGDVDRLQQILFYRELGISLADIREILDAPGFDSAAALRDHRDIIRKRMDRLQRQEITISHTLRNMASEETTMKDEEKFTGIGDFDHDRYRDEAMKKYGEAEVTASEERFAGWSDQQKAATLAAGEQIARELAELAGSGADPSGPEVRELARRQHEFVGRFWDCDLEAFRGMGHLYTDDERFAGYYERHAPGLAAYFRTAIDAYVDGELSGN